MTAITYRNAFPVAGDRPSADRLVAVIVAPRPRLILTGIAAAALAGCAPGVLDPAGPVGRGEKLILLDSLAIMLGIVIPTIVATLAFAWWFRAGNTKARRRPDFAFSGQLELLVWSIPAIVVVFLAGVTWVGSHAYDPPRPLRAVSPPIEVDVVAMDWKWLFIYPAQGVASVNRLVIPAGVPVRFRITSASVMNSFFVPRLGTQIYAMAGMESKLNLMADKPGTYRGLSAHYSGAGFADMTFPVNAVPPAQFATWVAQAKAGGGTLDNRAYLDLAKPSEHVPARTFGAVTPRLFDAAVHIAGTPWGPPHAGGRDLQ